MASWLFVSGTSRVKVKTPRQFLIEQLTALFVFYVINICYHCTVSGVENIGDGTRQSYMEWVELKRKKTRLCVYLPMFTFLSLYQENKSLHGG